MEEQFDICNQGSIMGKEERSLLRIIIKATDDPTFIFPDSENHFVPPYLKHLELDKFGVSQFLKYRSSEHPTFAAAQKLFARRLQDVLLNRLDSSIKFDLYLHDLVDHLIQESHFSDGLNLYTRVSKLPLKVHQKNYILFSNMEGRNAEGIVWLLQESFSKFDTRYKKGDIQIAASLVAACQNNFLQAEGELKIKTLFGIKVLGEEFFIYRIDFGEDYMRTLAEKPAQDLIVHRYPEARGLRISKLDDRRKLLYHLFRLREYMLSMSLTRSGIGPLS